MAEGNNHISLLCRNWKVPVCIVAITFIAVQSTMIYNHLFAIHPSCKSPNFTSWTWLVNFFEAIAFFVVIAIQICHLALRIVPFDEFGSYATTFSVSLLAGISSLIKLCTDWTGNCDDVFGVRFSGVLWAEWIACVPLLYYIVLATDTKLRLSQTDMIIIILITAVFLFGMCLHLTSSYALSVFLLIATISCYTAGSIIFYFVTLSNKDYFSRTQCESTERNEYEIRLKKTQKHLALCLLLILPLYPFVYFLSLFRVINHDIFFTLITILNVVAKLIFTSIANSAHHNVANEIIRLRLVAESLALTAETAANESRRLFVRFIMHEVRVPLNSITMGLGYLEQCPDIDDEAKEALLMMEGATGFMKQTLNDVLNMQRIEEGKFELDYAAFSIEKTINRVKASLQGIVKEKQINLIIQIHPAVPELVIGDGFRIEHVLVNLLSNALKFSHVQSDVVIDINVASVVFHLPVNSNENVTAANNNNNNDVDGSRPLGFLRSTLKKAVSGSNLNKIDISPQSNILPISPTGTLTAPTTSTTTLLFSVIDNGPGISDSDMKTLFLPFSQIRPHELQSGGGSGIGLVICKQIVELHGGTISCQSEVGVGSTFTVTIPFKTVAEVLRDESEGQGSGYTVKDRSVKEVSIPPPYNVTRIPETDRMCTTSPPSSTAPHQSSSYHSPTTFQTKSEAKSSNTSSLNFFNLLRQNSQEVGIDTTTYDNNNDNSKLSDSCHLLSSIKTNHDNNNNNHFESKENEKKKPNDLLSEYRDTKGLHSSRDLVISSGSSPNATVGDIHTSHTNIMDSSNITIVSDSKYHHHVIITETDTSTRPEGGKSSTSNNSLISPRVAASEMLTVTKRPIIRNVLLVDDVSSNRRILSMLLRRRGIDSTMAVNGLQGVNIVKEGNQIFDMIFMDNSMPIMTGVEATKQLRELGYPNLIIGVTGNAMEEDIIEFIAAGADAVILKPVTILQINQILEYAETHGNTHISNQKIVFTDTHYYRTK